jgi:hypothetical protein
MDREAILKELRTISAQMNAAEEKRREAVEAFDKELSSLRKQLEVLYALLATK